MSVLGIDYAPEESKDFHINLLWFVCEGVKLQTFFDLANDFLLFFAVGTLKWWQRRGFKYEVSALGAVLAIQYELGRVGVHGKDMKVLP